MSESDEYAIDAARFTDALREQRVARTPGGLYHLNQILMAYNSNRIEGSVLTEDQTRFIYETRTIFASGDEAVPVDDIVETVNSFELLDEMIDRLDAPITAQTMKDYHAILKRGTADARRSWFSVGDFKRMANEVGGKSTVAPEHVSIAIDELMPTTRHHAVHSARRPEGVLLPWSHRIREGARIPARYVPLPPGSIPCPIREIHRGSLIMSDKPSHQDMLTEARNETASATPSDR